MNKTTPQNCEAWKLRPVKLHVEISARPLDGPCRSSRRQNPGSAAWHRLQSFVAVAFSLRAFLTPSTNHPAIRAVRIQGVAEPSRTSGRSSSPVWVARTARTKAAVRCISLPWGLSFFHAAQLRRSVDRSSFPSSCTISRILQTVSEC